MASFLGEIKRRKVFQVAAVYAVVAWLLVQIIVSIETPLSLPPWSDTLVIVLLAVGFPVVLILGWVFDLTPEGVKATEAADGHGTARAPAASFTYVIQGLVLVAVSFLVIDQYLLDGETPSAARQAGGGERVARFTVSSPATVPNSALMPHVTSTAISPNGARMAWVSGGGGVMTDRRVYLRSLGELDAVPLQSTDGAYSTFFSFDGQWIGFAEQRGLYKVSVSGGPSLRVTDRVGVLDMMGARWTRDDTIVFATRTSGGLLRVGADGDEGPVQLTSIDTLAGETAHAWPDVLPDGESLLLTRLFASGEPVIAVYSTQSATLKDLWRGGSHARYSSTGHIVFAAGSELWALGFDPERLAITTTNPVRVEGNVQTDAGTGAAHFDLSDSGSLVYATAGEPQQTLVLVDREGQDSPLGFPARRYILPRLSPDGTRLSISFGGSRWVSDLARPSFQRSPAGGVLWRDNETLFAPTDANGLSSLALVSADGSDEPEHLATIDVEGLSNLFPEASTDEYLLFVYSVPSTSFDIGVLPLEESEDWYPFHDSRAAEAAIALHPEGEVIAYQSDRDGPYQIYLERFPDGEDRQLVSLDGGENAVWSHDGAELFYRRPSDGAMMVVRIEREPVLTVTAPEVLFPGDAFFLRSGRQYDVLPDGRFLMIKEPADDPGPSIVYVENFHERLSALLREN